MQNTTVLRLAQIQNIVGIKDAAGSVERGSDLLRLAPKNFVVYGGDDINCLALMLMGGHGVISVTANVAPKLMHQMCEAAFLGKVSEARAINNKLLELHRALFVEANPIPVKWAMQQMRLIGPGIRLPLTPLTASFHSAVSDAMRQAGIKF